MKNFLKLEKLGFQIEKNFFEKKKINKLLNNIKKRKGFKFYNSEKKFRQHGRFVKTNPDLKFNYLNKFNTKFIDNLLLNYIPGKIISKKIIHNVNKSFLPNWLLTYSEYIRGNINCYIKDKYQDETHFYGTSVHQDLLGNKKDFITAYIYLDKVKRNDSPLIIYDKTHFFGEAKFPIYLKKINNKYIYYNNGKSCFTNKNVLYGSCGDLILFNSKTLHATDTNKSKKNRISLRYLILPKKGVIKKRKYNNSKHLTFGMENDSFQLTGRYIV